MQLFLTLTTGRQIDNTTYATETKEEKKQYETIDCKTYRKGTKVSYRGEVPNMRLPEYLFMNTVLGNQI